MPTRPDDYTNPPPLVGVGDLGTSEWADQIAGNQPLVWDFPSFEVKQNLNATDLFQGTFVLPADGMGTFRHCWIWAQGTLKNGMGTAKAAPAWSVTFDANLLIDTGTGGNLADAGTSFGGFELNIHIQQSGSTSAQETSLSGFYFDGDDGSDFDTGDGVYRRISEASGGIITGRNTTAFDLSPGGTIAFKTRLPESSSQYAVFLMAGKAWIL